MKEYTKLLIKLSNDARERMRSLPKPLTKKEFARRIDKAFIKARRCDANEIFDLKRRWKKEYTKHEARLLVRRIAYSFEELLISTQKVLSGRGAGIKDFYRVDGFKTGLRFR